MPDDGARDAPSHGPDWLTSDGFFKVVTGHQEAIELLSDDRLEANLSTIFEGAGFRSGPVLEAAQASLLSMNGEQHRRYRSLIAPRFTPRAVEGVRDLVRAEATSRTEALLSADRCEVVAEFAAPYVTVGICDHVGFSRSEVSHLAEAIDRLGWSMKDLANRGEACTSAMVELIGYARDTLAGRTGDPTDDVLGLLATAIENGSITEEVASVLVGSLLSAGHEPTTNQIAIMVLTLGEHPGLWDDVGEGRAAIAPVVEELLRYRSTNPSVNRRVAQDMVHRGCEFTGGEQIFLSLEAANHDPRHYPAPDQLDPVANRGNHLAFGFGPHYCLGAALSRVQLQEALLALTTRLVCPRIIEHVPHEGAGLQGPGSLTISVTPR